MQKSSFNSPDGATLQEKFDGLGIRAGESVDIMDLKTLHDRDGVEVFLIFEKEFADDFDYPRLMDEFADVPEYERPFISVGAFLEFGAGNDPLFESRLRDFPLMIIITSFGEYVMPGDAPVPFVAGLMPFVDEIEW